MLDEVEAAVEVERAWNDVAREREERAEEALLARARELS
jgi:hypothetical protein